MKNYTHLDREERRLFAVLLKRGDSLRSIAAELGRSHSSLSREIKRNQFQRRYHAFDAECLARRRRRQNYSSKLSDPALKQIVESALRKRWSPELICGRLKRQSDQLQLSYETVYRWIYREARHLIRFLPRHHRLRGKYRLAQAKSIIPGRVSVSARPLAAQLRTQPGHWEVDLMIGKGQSALQVAVDRSSRYTRIVKVQDKTAQSSFAAVCRILARLPLRLRQSLTYDNGVENLLHRQINRKFHTRSFFCHPYCFWEKPTVENTNGLIRRFLPKSTNFDTISDRKIRAIQHWLNSRPRKCLQFKTPAEALSGALQM